MKKNILNEGLYTAVIFQAELTDTLDLIWVVDTGEDKGHKIFQSFNTASTHSVDKFSKLCEGLMFFMPKLYQLKEQDAEKMVGLRGEVKVMIVQKSNVLKNVIVDYNITEVAPEFDPFKEKTDEHFKVGANKKKLPIL